MLNLGGSFEPKVQRTGCILDGVGHLERLHRDCTLSRKEVQGQPAHKWYTSRKQPKPNAVQHGDQSTSTIGPR